MFCPPAMPVSSADTRAVDPYRALFEQLPSGIARCRPVLDRDQVVAVEIVESNRAFDGVRGALPRLLEVFSRVRETARPVSIQVRSERDVLSVSAYLVGDAVDDVMLVIDDVTPREELAQRAREWQVRFEQAFHGNSAAMVIASRSDLRIVDVNPPWLELFGATRADVVGRTSVELGLISDAHAQTRIAQHDSHADGHDTELELSTRGGGKLTVLASAKPIEIAEGTCTLTTLIDITQRKHAEEAFSVAFSASPAGMMLVDHATDTVVAVNDRLLEMTERRRDEFVGHPVSKLGMVASPPRAVLLEQIARGGRLDGVEVELARPTGPPVYTLASTEMVTLHGKVHRLSVFTDLTARKQLETELRDLNGELEHRVRERTRALETSNRDLDAFSLSVSHDLRAPLRAIAGFSEILLTEFAPAMSDEARHLLTRIHASGGRLHKLVEDLLAFAQLGRGKPQRSWIGLDSLVRSLVDDLVTGRRLGERVELRLSPLGGCRADPSLIRTVWTNLIDNALKYSSGRPRIVLEIGSEQRDAETVYYVADNGVGFDMAHADRLFGMFQRLHAASEFDGTGIGLANVRRIVERHHGHISASSQPGSGSRFEFTLGPEAT
jgi:PAS domain S-box-containing protein